MKSIVGTMLQILSYSENKRKKEAEAYMFWKNEYRSESFDYVYNTILGGKLQ